MMGSNRYITIYRPSGGDGSADYTSTTTIASNIEAYIMEIKLEHQQFYNLGSPYRAYTLNLDGFFDLIVNDKIVDDLNNTYFVHSVEKIDDPIDSYMVAVLRRKVL